MVARQDRVTFKTNQRLVRVPPHVLEVQPLAKTWLPILGKSSAAETWAYEVVEDLKLRKAASRPVTGPENTGLPWQRRKELGRRPLGPTRPEPSPNVPLSRP